MNTLFFSVLMAMCFSVFFSKLVTSHKAKFLERSKKDEILMVSAESNAPPKLIDLVNRFVTMARCRAVLVQDDSLTVIYARENRTKGRVKFKMDSAFDDVHEGDVGVLIIIDQEIHGKVPFYKFIRDADIPTIADVIDLGTGDYLTDRIYAAAFEKGKGELHARAHARMLSVEPPRRGRA